MGENRARQRHRCYATAAAVALRNRHVTYTEGIDFHADDPRPVPHAWLTDRAGEVVDLSAHGVEVYYGIPIPATVYARCVPDGIARPVLPVRSRVRWRRSDNRVVGSRLGQAYGPALADG